MQKTEQSRLKTDSNIIELRGYFRDRPDQFPSSRPISKFPSVQVLSNDPRYHTYRCPHCKKILFHGLIQHLRMACFHCYKHINCNNSELLS